MSTEYEEILAAGRADAEDALVMDLSEAVDNDFEPFEGRHPIVVEKVVAGKIKTGDNAGKGKLDLTVKVTAGEFINRKLFPTLPLAGRGAGMTKRFLAGLGYEIDPEAPTIDPQALVGLEGVAVCKIRAAEGEYKAKTEVKDIVAAEEADLPV